MGTAACQRCGRKYSVAQALAGTVVVCRSCGAENDGAGVSRPAGDTSTNGKKGTSSLDDPYVVETQAEVDAPPVPPVWPTTAPRRSTTARATRGGGPSGAVLIAVGCLAAIVLLVVVNTIARRRPPEPAQTADVTKESPELGKPIPSHVETPQDGTERAVAEAAPEPPQPPPSLAERLDPVANFPGSLFTSNILGMTDFDAEFLLGSDGDAIMTRLYESLVTPLVKCWAPESEIARLTDVAGGAAIARSVIFGGLLERRPTCSVRFPKSAAGERIGIYLSVPHEQQAMFSPSADGLISARSDVLLSERTSPDAARDAECIVREGQDLFEVPVKLPWRAERIRDLEQPETVEFTLRVQYSDRSVDLLHCSVRLQPPGSVDTTYPLGLGFATIIDEQHPLVATLVSEINNDPQVKAAGLAMSGGGAGAEGQLASLALVWRELVLRGVSYQNLTGSEDLLSQRCRLLHECLNDRAANCIDGTALLASLLQATDMNCSVVFLPGHALLCIALPVREGWPSLLFVETTSLGRKIRRDPDTAGPVNRMFADLRREHPFFNGEWTNSLELACDSGRRTVHEHLAKLDDLFGDYRALHAEQARSGLTDRMRKRLGETLDRMAQELLIVPVRLARQHGVHSVGSPANVKQRYPLPPRRFDAP